MEKVRAELVEIVTEFWEVLGEMSPYLLFGFLVAGLLSVYVRRSIVEKHLGGRGLWPIVKASILGVPLPLCSCGVIPVAASLRKHGASRGATASFLLSTPQTGVDSILATFSLLGPVFAIFRPVTAMLTGVLGGAAVSLVEPRGAGNDPAIECTDECCAPTGKAQSHRLVRALRYGFRTLPRDIGKALLVGLLIAGGIAALVPQDFFGRVLGGGILTMLVMMAVGIPVYVCATASIPIAAALIAKGVSPGAALVFLLTGPATNAATVATIWKTMGRRTVAVYLVSVAATALASGLLLDAIFAASGVNAVHVPAWELPGWAKAGSSLLLLGVLGYALLPRRRRRASVGDSCGDGDCCAKQ